MTLATGGDNTYDDGGFRYHEFTSTGSADLTVTEAGDVEVLLVAGGGGGGWEGSDANFAAAGAGAGGVLVDDLTLSATTHSVTVGTGGAGATTGAASGGSGGNSSMSTLTAIGGGGGSTFDHDGGSGGSGGGATDTTSAGSGTAGQGNAGGTATGHCAGAGGGGAGAVGGNVVGGAGSTGGTGGAGITVWSLYTVGGGGGGGGSGTAVCGGVGAPGPGGTGGGGTGGSSSALPTAGTPNTGGGGGGGSGIASSPNGAAGGSGIVVVRYPLTAELVGTVAAGGTLTGSLTATAPQADLVGVLAGGGSLTGTLTATSPAADMTGQLPGGGALAGELTVTGPEIDMTGLLDGGGTLAGLLTVTTPEADMVGVLGAGGVLFGQLTTSTPPEPVPIVGCGWEPTTAQLLDLDGVRRRADSFRFELLDRDEEVIGELRPDRERPPTITNTVDNTIPRQMRGFHLPDHQLNDINVVSDRVRAVMVLQNGAEFPLGIFLWADDSSPVRSWEAQERYSSLSDKMLMFNQSFVGSVGWGPGSGGNQGVSLAMVFLVLQVISQEEFGDGNGAEAARVAFADPVSWSPGTTWHKALTDLGQLVGFAPPFFDRDGIFRFGLPPNLDQVPPTVTFRPGGTIIADSIITSDDLLKAPNLFGVYDSGPSSTRIGRYALPSSAPHSRANRGFTVAMVEPVQGLASNSQANRAARSLATTKGVAFDWVEFKTTADPRLDSWDVIGLQLREGEPVLPWLETAWTMECRSGGVMSHTARRVHT